MTNNDSLINQMILLLAGSGMSENQLMQLLVQLKAVAPVRILEAVHVHRQMVSPKMARSIRYSYAIEEEPSKSRLIDKEAIDRIERLVVTEAGLSKTTASRLIVSMLKKRHPQTVFPTFDSKKGFGRWLAQVSENVSLGEILHVVAALRNEIVHSPKDEWITK